jgi:hypothetical protein
MDEHVRATLLGALGHVFQPMVRLALRNGLSFEDFTHGLKRVFVESAMRDFEVEGKSLSTAKMSILTGIDRGDVHEFEEEIRGGFGSELQIMALVASVLEGWGQDADFTGPYGIPKELPMEPGPGSFPALVEKYAGRVPPRLMLREIRRVGLAELRRNRKVRMVSRSLIAGRFRPDAIRRMGRTLGHLAETLEYNLNPRREGPARFERSLYTQDSMDPETAEDFEDFVSEAGQDFLEKLDNWISEKEQEEDRKVRNRLVDPDILRESKNTKVGVSVFVYKDVLDDSLFIFPSDGEQDNGAGKSGIGQKAS